MAVERVIALFKAAKSDVALKNKIQNSLSKESFIEMASGEGYQFNEDELNLILKIVKQTSLNPCSIEQVIDDSSDFLESESAPLRGNINRFRRASLDINIVLSESISTAPDINDTGKIIAGIGEMAAAKKPRAARKPRETIEAIDTREPKIDTREPKDATGIVVKLKVNINLSQADSSSWSDNRATIISTL
jgi:Nif11 domain